MDGGIEEGNQKGGEGGKGKRVGTIRIVRWAGRVGRESERIGAVGRGEG